MEQRRKVGGWVGLVGFSRRRGPRNTTFGHLLLVAARCILFIGIEYPSLTGVDYTSCLRVPGFDTLDSE